MAFTKFFSLLAIMAFWASGVDATVDKKEEPQRRVRRRRLVQERQQQSRVLKVEAEAKRQPEVTSGAIEDLTDSAEQEIFWERLLEDNGSYRT